MVAAAGQLVDRLVVEVAADVLVLHRVGNVGRHLDGFLYALYPHLDVDAGGLTDLHLLRCGGGRHSLEQVRHLVRAGGQIAEDVLAALAGHRGPFALQAFRLGGDGDTGQGSSVIGCHPA